MIFNPKLKPVVRSGRSSVLCLQFPARPLVGNGATRLIIPINYTQHRLQLSCLPTNSVENRGSVASENIFGTMRYYCKYLHKLRLRSYWLADWS